MNIPISSIFHHFKTSELVIEFFGPDNSISGISSIEEYGQGDLVFLDNKKFVATVRANPPAAIVTTASLAAELRELDNMAILVADNVRLASAHIRQKYADRDLYNTEWPRIHPSAVIDQSVDIPENAVIGPGAVIGARVVLGQKVVVMANAVVENDALIGEATVIHPNCVVGYQCEIGDHVILKSGCIIGSEGTGFAQDKHRHYHRIPQVGKVVIEGRVVIGANCTIDRATFKETRIHSGCIIDALCHIAHNVSIGEDCILIAQTGIAGSSRFGKRVIASGQTGVLDHVTVPDDTVLLHRAGVINSIKKSGVYATTPPQPFKKYLKNIAVFQRLGEMWVRLKTVEKTLEKLSR